MNDHAFMAQAIALAARGLYTTDPNPRVGCLLVKEGVVVGSGWHQVAGGDHAEVVALKQAGSRAAGATAYVTLEPCSHHGKTPPCADALIAAGVKAVVIAGEDPNPKVSGSGVHRLQQAGIAVRSGVMQAQAEALNPGFLMRMRRGRPFVRCKMAMSLDGRTAMASGESQWITAAAAREDGQRLRARSSAIMTGIGTVLADDPQLTVRLEGVTRQPLRIVLDPHLSTPPSARIVQGGKSLIVTAVSDSDYAPCLLERGAEILYLPQGDRDEIDLKALLHHLAEREINEIHLEAGATLAGSMLELGLIDELVIYMAAKIMGNSARGLFNLPHLTELAAAVELKITDLRAIGADWRITAQPQWPPLNGQP